MNAEEEGKELFGSWGEKNLISEPSEPKEALLYRCCALSFAEAPSGGRVG